MARVLAVYAALGAAGVPAIAAARAPAAAVQVVAAPRNTAPQRRTAPSVRPRERPAPPPRAHLLARPAPHRAVEIHAPPRFLAHRALLR